MPPDANRFSVRSALDGFLLAKGAEGRSPKTLADYRYSVGLLLTWLETQARAGEPVDRLTTHDLRRFLVALRERQPPLSPKTIKNAYTGLSSFWTWLGQEFGLPHRVRPIEVPRAHPPAMRLPNRDDIRRLLRACEYTSEARTRGRQGFRMRRPTGARDRCIVLLLLDTGLRAGELCGLALQDVDLQAGSILVRHAKGRRQRIVYAGKATRGALWRYVAGERQGCRGDDLLFVTRHGRPLTVDRLSHLVAALGRRAGLRLWPHLLRHVFATEFLRGGGSTLALRRLLGHVSDAMLERYVTLADVDLQRAHEQAGPADRWRL